MNEDNLTFTVTPKIDYNRLAAAVAERLVDMNGTNRWMPTKQAQTYTGHGKELFGRFVIEHQIPVHRDGRTNFYDRLDLDRAMKSL
jgi:hypothetical protein